MTRIDIMLATQFAVFKVFGKSKFVFVQHREDHAPLAPKSTTSRARHLQFAPSC